MAIGATRQFAGSISILYHCKPQNGINGYRITGGLVVDWLQRSSTLVLGVGMRGIPKLMAAIFQTTFYPQYLYLRSPYFALLKASAHCANDLNGAMGSERITILREEKVLEQASP